MMLGTQIIQNNQFFKPMTCYNQNLNYYKMITTKFQNKLHFDPVSTLSKILEQNSQSIHLLISWQITTSYLDQFFKKMANNWYLLLWWSLNITHWHNISALWHSRFHSKVRPIWVCHLRHSGKSLLLMKT